MHGVPRSRFVGKYVENVAGHARSTFGRLEYRIAKEHGFDLYEVKQWPVEKKLVYNEHMLAEAEAQQQNTGMDGVDIPNMDSMPGNAQQAMQQMGGGQQNNWDGHDIPPDLQKYDTHINVVGDDDGDGDDSDG